VQFNGDSRRIQQIQIKQPNVQQKPGVKSVPGVAGVDTATTNGQTVTNSNDEKQAV